MSFSKSFRGAPLAILAAIAAFPAEQKAIDAGCAEGVITGHQKQIDASVAGIKPAVEGVNETAELQVSIWGHANPDESGSYGYSVQVSGLTTPAVEVTAPTPAVDSEDGG